MGYTQNLPNSILLPFDVPKSAGWVSNGVYPVKSIRFESTLFAQDYQSKYLRLI